MAFWKYHLVVCVIVTGLYVRNGSSLRDSRTNKDIPYNAPGAYACLNYTQRRLTDEQRLLETLMYDYDRSTRPVFNASHAVVIELGITLNQIFDLDERNQVLTTHIWLDQEWDDEKLKWDPADYNGLHTLRIPCSHLWLPDTVLYNSADDYTEGYMKALAMVHNTGHVFWPPIVRLRSTCSIDITYFPFDDQICTLKLGSWAYDGFQVDVTNRSASIDLTNYVSNGEWELLDVIVRRNVEYYTCCPEPYPDVTFTLHIRRRTLYYTYNVIIPCIMLSILTLLGFWMPPDGGEKVALGLTVLLSFSVFMLLIAENMPATSFYVPLIGVYLTSVMAMTSISVIMAVVISNLHHQSQKDRMVPRWMRKLCMFLGRGLGIRTPSLRESLHIDTGAPPDSKTPLNESFNSYSLKFRNINESECNLIDLTEQESKAKETPKNGNDNNIRNKQHEEILRRLRMIMVRQEEILKTQYENRDWIEVGDVVDRVLFWLYSTTMLLITVTILIFVPLAKSVKIDK